MCWDKPTLLTSSDSSFSKKKNPAVVVGDWVGLSSATLPDSSLRVSCSAPNTTFAPYFFLGPCPLSGVTLLPQLLQSNSRAKHRPPLWLDLGFPQLWHLSPSRVVVLGVLLFHALFPLLLLLLAPAQTLDN